MQRRSTPAIRLDIQALAEGVNHLGFEVAPQALELAWPDVEFVPAFRVDLEVVRVGGDLQIDGRWTGRLRCDCDRCLKSFDRNLGGGFRALGRRGSAETHELGSEDGVVFHDGHTLDLTGEVRQAILLEVPIQQVCFEECRGLCPRCGTDLNQERCACPATSPDPRWATLQSASDPGDQAAESAESEEM